jgi:PAS domain S-box-containing protein
MQWADALVSAFTEAVVVTDVAVRVRAWTPAAQALAAENHPIVGRPVRESFAFFDDAAVLDALQDAIARGETRVVEWRVPHVAVELWLEARATPWRDATGEITGLVVFLADITARRREAGFAAALATVGQSLSSSLDLNEVLDTVATRTLEVMGADSAMVVGWDGEAPLYQVLRATGRLSREYIAAGGIPAGGGPIARAVREKLAVTTPNILTDSAFWLTPERRSEIEQEGFLAVAAAPLAARARVHGALVVHYWRERQFAGRRGAGAVAPRHAGGGGDRQRASLR